MLILTMKNIINNFFIIICLFFTLDLYASGLEKVSVNQSNIILHDGTFENGLPITFMIDVSKKTNRWGYGNWKNNSGYANIAFSQMGPDWILHETGMIPKKILKSWSVEDYKLGKKKGFKSSGNRALIQLAEINNKKCVVIISRFGSNAQDAGRRLRSSLDGYICKNSGEITIDQGMNYLHCIELRGDHNYKGKDIDNKCVKKKITKNTIEKSKQISQQTKETAQNNNESSFEEKLTKLKSLFDKELITKEEYDKKRKEILDQM
jgi:hypothetical protein